MNDKLKNTFAIIGGWITVLVIVSLFFLAALPHIIKIIKML